VARRLSRLLADAGDREVYLAFDVGAINSAWAPGVSFPNIVGGLTQLEAAELGLVIGFWRSVRCISFTEYSPCVEDLRTGSLLSEMIYNILLGEALSRKEIQSPA
jgi:arginase family enzyme